MKSVVPSTYTSRKYCAILARRENRILVPDEPTMLEEHTIAVDEQRECLAHRPGAVHECDVMDVNVVPRHARRVRRERVDRPFAGVIVPLDDRTLHALADDGDARLPLRDQQLLTIDAVADEDRARNRRIVTHRVDRFLNRSEIAGAIGGHGDIKRIRKRAPS
jgi:hypothetical protein